MADGMETWKPEMSATSSDADWPRNGALLKGKESDDHPGWVQFEDGRWLPTTQHGTQILFKQ
ncbi:uncharacterized protein AMSG_09266 [Thecamonas trahens ATCC 50062]|uniref:Uncharacterized protein n=1 Tax=Thecamonas trahens ATCC 50062 TaxID=461836 RepID=A0A0L0DLR0_THETB|nr:hypothetical protein AMSG_09266 [Thecamonas trahens ATCC 50062]KNC53185.1 hypothetical protein AMSG_09266 [Thecamonas trahens ATCC 50062]|eukprot:XP_013754657.1 hypothetical protein AMSG_09266 [Thecamonas trahens ATCC 50062]